MREVLPLARLDQHRAGIGNAGHARVGHIGDVTAVFERGDDLFGAFAFVVRVQGTRRFFDVEMIEQKPRMARIFAVNDVDRGQRLDRSRTQIAEVADGGCDKVQHQRTLVLRLSPRSSTIAVSAPSIMRLATRSP